MSTLGIAERLIVEEEGVRIANEKRQEIKKELIKIDSSISKNTALLKKLVTGGGGLEGGKVKAEVKPGIELVSNSWYQTGLKTLDATERGDYTLENIVTALDGPSYEGNLTNFGPGSLFVVFSQNAAEFTANELVMLPSAVFRWAPTFQKAYEVRYIHIRADVDGTEYQISAF